MSAETRTRALLLQFKLSQGEANRVRQELRAFRGDLAQVEAVQREIRTTALAGAEGEGRLARAMRESAQAAKLAGTGYDQSAKELRDLTRAASDAERQLRDTNAASAAGGGGFDRGRAFSRGERGFASGAQLLGIISPGAAEGARVIADTLGVLDDVPEAFAAIQGNVSQLLTVAGPAALAVGAVALAVSEFNRQMQEARTQQQQADQDLRRSTSLAEELQGLTTQEATVRQSAAKEQLDLAQAFFDAQQGAVTQLRSQLEAIESKGIFEASSEDFAEALRLRERLGVAEAELARIQNEELNPAFSQYQQIGAALINNQFAVNDAMDIFSRRLKSVPSILEGITGGFLEQSRAATAAQVAEVTKAAAVATDVYIAKTEDYKEKTDELSAAQGRLVAAKQAVHEAEKSHALALEQIAADLQSALDKASADRGAALAEAQREAELARVEAIRDAQAEREKAEEEHQQRLAEIDRRAHSEQTSAIGRRDVLAFIESKQRQREATSAENTAHRTRQRDIERNLRETTRSINLRLNEQRRTIEQRYNEQLRVAHEKAQAAVRIEQQRAQAELAIRQQAVQAEVAIMNQLASAIKALLSAINVPIKTTTTAQSVPIPKTAPYSGFVPTFQTGGRITRSGLAFVDRGEVILNQRQQRGMGAMTFAPVIHGSTRRQIEKQVLTELHSLLTDVGVD